MTYIKRLLQNENSPEAIVGLITVVMRMAMFVADTWAYTCRRRTRTTTELPPYKWYYLNLATARQSFEEMITDDTDDPNEISIPFATRDELKDVHVGNLWNTLWEEAKVICESIGSDQSQLRYHMYA
jgi:hypothetical protein